VTAAASTRLLVTGVGGRMGQEILKLIASQDEFSLAGALERKGSPLVGKRAEEIISSLPASVTVRSEPANFLDSEGVLIDFTRPEATREFVMAAIETGTPAVIGTTGIDKKGMNQIKNLAELVPVVYATNMSLGINLLRRLIVQASESLGEGFDAEILEMHHRHKEDAPSGTALTLAEDLAEARGLDLGEVACFGREGFTGERDQDTIGLLALRGGDVAGEHTVYFAGEGERVELTHRASSRETFAHGALRAARFVTQASPGLYDMQDVLFD